VWKKPPTLGTSSLIRFLTSILGFANHENTGTDVSHQRLQFYR
jgi:hypothetical protein